MDEVNINKYFGQFNPILIIPVLSAIVGAILFLFGFKRPNEPRLSSDSLKKSKRKANTVKTTENAVQSSKQQNAVSAKVNSGKKANDASANVAGKKGATADKSSGTTNTNTASTTTTTTNNNNTSSNNNNINKKKTEEKKSDNGSPAKKVANKKVGKEATTSANKKQSKANKNMSSDGKDIGEKPADFDDGGWFTVQSKSTKQKNKVDELAGNQTDSSSPKPQPTKNNKATKVAKVEIKPLTAAQPVAELTTAADNLVTEPAVEPNTNEVAVEATVPEIVAEPATAVVEITVPTVEKKAAAAPIAPAAEVNAVVDNAIAFDELGEWTDAKPDRKRGNKKKSRKD